jgi:aldehyde dehydrogenase
VDKALDAAHAAKAAWGKTSGDGARATCWSGLRSASKTTWRCWPTAETWDNGKPIRETMAADMPLAVDHFRYFAGCMRAQEGSISQIDATRWRITSTSRWAWWG